MIEESIDRTPDDINQSKILYDPPPRVMEIKTKVNKWDLIKRKSFLHAQYYASGLGEVTGENERLQTLLLTVSGSIIALLRSDIWYTITSEILNLHASLEAP